ncbi:tetratricopeptide repeat protein [Rhodopirellula sp. JC740]|uniref:Tetratricopeptide repeat protein n=1 Tax=Rhodopirellula halodulae TaxID=2894198 RepID=A0ABS8NGC0_9BACT|nr:tetratricopeptide repeat protein [Rhodopirellula sp. JC740]MCC9641893.1 tetratricopeptide repeat protein [Rhodopirellula sp. JC740]
MSVKKRKRQRQESTTPNRPSWLRRPITWVLLALAGGLLLLGTVPQRVHWQRYETQLRNTNFAAATRAIEAAEKWWASTDDVMLGKAEILGRQGYDEEALSAIVVAENFGAAPSTTAAAKARLQWQSGRLDQRAQQFQSGNFTSDDFAAVSMGHLVRGELDTAEKVLKVWREQYPQDAAADVTAALIAQENEELQRAGDLLRQAVQKNPRHVGARFQLAQHQYAIRNFDAALAGFESVIHSLESSVPDGDRVSINGEQLHASRFIRALILQEQNRIEDAETQFQELLDLYPNDFAIRYSLANMYALNGKGDEIISALRPILDQFPDDISLNYLMATAEALRGNFELADGWIGQYLNARRQLNQLIEAERQRAGQPPNPEFYMQLAEAYLKYKWDDAKPWIDLAASLQPQSPRIRRGYQIFYENSGNWEQAARYRQ